jgi:hypothetical protein
LLESNAQVLAFIAKKVIHRNQDAIADFLGVSASTVAFAVEDDPIGAVSGSIEGGDAEEADMEMGL